MEDKSSMEEKNSINEKDSIEVKNSIEERNSAEDSMEEAVGLLEVYGLVCAFLAADVRLEIFDKNKPANAELLPVPLLVTVKFRGSVAAVEAAMEAGERKAKSVTGVVQRHIIPRPTGDTGKMLKISAFDKN